MFNCLHHVVPCAGKLTAFFFVFDLYLTANTIDVRQLLLSQRFRDREYDKPVNVVFLALLSKTMLLDFAKK